MRITKAIAVMACVAVAGWGAWSEASTQMGVRVGYGSGNTRIGLGFGYGHGYGYGGGLYGGGAYGYGQPCGMIAHCKPCVGFGICGGLSPAFGQLGMYTGAHQMAMRGGLPVMPIMPTMPMAPIMMSGGYGMGYGRYANTNIYGGGYYPAPRSSLNIGFRYRSH